MRQQQEYHLEAYGPKYPNRTLCNTPGWATGHRPEVDCEMCKAIMLATGVYKP